MRKLIFLFFLFTPLAAAQSNIGGSSGSGSNQSSAGAIDPTQSPYNAKADVKSGSDGSLTAGANAVLTSTNQSCASTDAGKLVIFINNANNTYPMGFGLVTVTGCSGNSWVTNGNGGAGVGGSNNWAVGTANGTPLSTAYTAALNGNGVIALPCGGIIVETRPFPALATLNMLVQTPDIQGCLATGGTHFFLHPNLTESLLTGGCIFACFNAGSYTTGTPTWSGLGGQSKINNIFLTSLGGLMPGSASSATYNIVSGFNQVSEMVVQELGIGGANSTVNVIQNLSGEAHHHKLNFQTFIANSGNTHYFGVAAQGQGINLVDDTIFAFAPLIGFACSGGGSYCNLINSYCAQTNGCLESSSGSGNVLTYIGVTCTTASGTGGLGCIADNGNATTIYAFANPLISNSSTNTAPIQITNASTVLDISGSAINSATSGFDVTGTGRINDRAGNSWSSPLTQFTGQYVPVAGGSMDTYLPSAATNFGANLATQTLVSSVISSTSLNIQIGSQQVTAGVGCGAGSNTVFATLAWTAQGGNAQTQVTTTLTISANGAVDSGATAFQTITIPVEIGTAITYTTTSTLVSTGCSTTPQYKIVAAVI